MRVSLRLYRNHDIDLVILYRNKDFGFHKCMRRALKSHIHNEPYFVLPPTSSDVSKKEYKYVYQLFITFDEDKDADIIEWFSHIKKGGRNEAIKSLMRSCILGSFSYGCMIDDADRKNTDDINTLFFKTLEDNPMVFAPPVRCEQKNKQKAKSKKTKKSENLNKPQEKFDKKSYTKVKEDVKPVSVTFKEDDSTKKMTNKDFEAVQEDDFDLFSSTDSLIGQFM